MVITNEDEVCSIIRVSNSYYTQVEYDSFSATLKFCRFTYHNPIVTYFFFYKRSTVGNYDNHEI
jgi:hypothetical protein